MCASRSRQTTARLFTSAGRLRRDADPELSPPNLSNRDERPMAHHRPLALKNRPRHRYSRLSIISGRYGDSVERACDADRVDWHMPNNIHQTTFSLGFESRNPYISSLTVSHDWSLARRNRPARNELRNERYRPRQARDERQTAGRYNALVDDETAARIVRNAA